MKSTKFLTLLVVLCPLVSSSTALAQAVAVTMKLDKPSIAVGETTTLHVFAQIVSVRRATSDRIFSWYVDLLNTNGAAAKINGDGLLRPSSDRDPRSSSSGTAEGPNRRGIYDTFLNLAGAGRDTPVELFSVPIQGTAVGKTTFKVAAGSGVGGLSADFIVAPSGGGDPLLGGDYSVAGVNLDIVAGGPILAITAVPFPDGISRRVTVSFTPALGQNHFVEYRDSLSTGAWQTLPNGPHNSGNVVDTTTVSLRFYRLRIGN